MESCNASELALFVHFNERLAEIFVDVAKPEEFDLSTYTGDESTLMHELAAHSGKGLLFTSRETLLSAAMEEFTEVDLSKVFANFKENDPNAYMDFTTGFITFMESVNE